MSSFRLDPVTLSTTDAGVEPIVPRRPGEPCDGTYAARCDTTITTHWKIGLLAEVEFQASDDLPDTDRVWREESLRALVRAFNEIRKWHPEVGALYGTTTRTDANEFQLYRQQKPRPNQLGYQVDLFTFEGQETFPDPGVSDPTSPVRRWYWGIIHQISWEKYGFTTKEATEDWGGWDVSESRLKFQELLSEYLNAETLQQQLKVLVTPAANEDRDDAE
ncbi:uncharacterized protein BO97DRAFT_422620 [Aspergillus homomorphus CBS 101889]|uniref:Uncharacterized protein n=1 Tax=Aspergillus homomorphus (strain CBS 101889) TaxID=1450537 RepID=A0A395I6B0_ASPHC|nr:hypothetical protein BO97DRAFT_422620 [Aspergillus homomorphus CBS 101889]RAL14728.1 hypothetical protein BO97DRAFT_422620 [Aspergillus homomorphus CBS 101889]